MESSIKSYLSIDLNCFNNLLAAGQGISTFRVLNYIINIAYANGSDTVSFKYNEIAEVLGYGIRCIGENIRYLCKTGVLIKTGYHEYTINKDVLNVYLAANAF